MSFLEQADLQIPGASPYYFHPALLQLHNPGKNPNCSWLTYLAQIQSSPGYAYDGEAALRPPRSRRRILRFPGGGVEILGKDKAKMFTEDSVAIWEDFLGGLSENCIMAIA